MAPDPAIASTVKQYILDEFLPGENPDELAADTPLITTGIIDSVGTLKLVSFLEERFNIGLAAHEADVEYLNTIADIVKLVESKQKAG
jgi:acyl carrier protein